MKVLKDLTELPWLREENEPVAKAEWYFPSVSVNASIHAEVWKSPARPRAILQIAHGMAEHVDRYDAFARRAAEHDILVVGEDHLGHGKTASDPSQFGYFAMEDGQELVVRDMYALTRQVREIYPDTPYFLLGHSMGAMLSELYAVRYPDVLTALLLSGLPAKNPVAKLAKKSVERHIFRFGLFSRDAKVGLLMNKLYNRKIHPTRTEFDWLSTLDEEVDKYVRDPLCGFPFTAAGLRDLLSCNIAANSPRWFDSTPKFLPIHIFAGTEDPVGGYGKGVEKIYRQLLRRKREVTLKLYEGARHEILNDFCREEAATDILAAVFRHLPSNSEPNPPAVSTEE